MSGGLFESVRRLHLELLRSHVESPEIVSPGKQPVQVSVLGTRDEFTTEDIEAWRPVNVSAFEISGPRSFGYAPGVIEELLVLDPDLVHVHGLWQHSSCVALRWHSKTARPYIVSPHGMLDTWAMAHSRWKKRVCWTVYEKRHLESAACIRALCKGEADAIRAAGLKKPVCLIPNGVDLPNLGTEAKCGPEFWNGRLAGRKVLLYLGRIHPKKGLRNLIEAWRNAQKPQEWLLVIAGWDQGGHEAELMRLAGNRCADCEEADREPVSEGGVFFAGPQYGVAKRAWFRRCDAFILPSYSEGLPMAVLEAWSFAKPVLMTPECNLPEGFAAGASISIGGCVDGVARGLKTLFCVDNKELGAMGARGRELVARRFAWQRVAMDLKGVYQWIIGAGPKPGCVG